MKFIDISRIHSFRIVTPLAGVWIEIPLLSAVFSSAIVTPLAGVWIEMTAVKKQRRMRRVTPLAGVRIEITITYNGTTYTSSLPLRECGLKSDCRSAECLTGYVTPLAGEWIEIRFDKEACLAKNVTPLAGVRIEIAYVSAELWA